MAEAVKSSPRAVDLDTPGRKRASNTLGLNRKFPPQGIGEIERLQRQRRFPAVDRHRGRHGFQQDPALGGAGAKALADRFEEHVQLFDEEDTQDARAGAFLSKFTGQMLAVQS